MARAPGEGEPGQPGVRGGGTGGRGGAGGRGGTTVGRDWRDAALIFMVLIAIGLSIGTLLLISKVNANTNANAMQERQIDRLQQANIVTLRKADADHVASIKIIYGTDYRLCLRQQIVRAAVDLDRNHDEPILPLYDCKPDLHGGVATRLTPAQTAAFEQYVRTAKNLP
jgi:hypothetical protein